HTAYVNQLRVDGYAEHVRYVLGRKATFDRRILASKGEEVIYNRGDLVQYVNSVWDYTFKSTRKLIWYWSTPYRVHER
ncbi:hypothetical protein B0H19DRAFT_869234, partial [Mycena capillaripes]